MEASKDALENAYFISIKRYTEALWRWAKRQGYRR